MPTAYQKHYSKRKTPQSQPIPGEAQVKNNAGGYVYSLDSWATMQRFLILGTEGGSYYASEAKMSRDAAKAVDACIAADGQRAVDLIVAISDGGRAPSNDPALFALALAAGAPDPATRALALAALPKVARIPTHLFHFVEYIKGVRGWGRGLRRAIGQWVDSFDANKLAYEFAKYQQRDGWSNADVIRKAHVVVADPQKDAVIRWALGGLDEVSKRRQIKRQVASSPNLSRVDHYVALSQNILPDIILAMEALKTETSESKVIRAITDHGLTREMIPTSFLKSARVWEALLEKMPLEAMIRNLPQMTRVKLLEARGPSTRLVEDRLGAPAYLRKARTHPLKVLNALKFYSAGGRLGRGFERAGADATFTPVRAITDALDSAFYLCFGNVVPTGKGIVLGIDISGSMDMGQVGKTALTPREASAALALVTARVEKDYAMIGFTSSGRYGGNGVTEITISPKQRLDDVMQTMSALPMGGTDAALVYQWAEKQTQPYGAAVIYTDNETWAGVEHSQQALRRYRERTGLPVKQVVVGMTATMFTIADPQDPLSLDVVGFDLSTPDALSEFIRG